MQLDKDLLIGGVSAASLRTVLKHTEFNTRDFLNRCPGTRENAPIVLEQLLKEGYLVRDEEDDSRYETTLKGNALAHASLRRYSRKAADKTLLGLMKRVHTVNTDQEYAYIVEELVLFGSYLGESPDVGDIDVAYKLRHWSPDHAAQKERTAIRRKAHGQFSTFMEELAFPEQEVLRFLKARSPLIKLCSDDQPVRLKAKRRVIYHINKPACLADFLRDKFGITVEEMLQRR